jgi:hypothetical protein
VKAAAQMGWSGKKLEIKAARKEMEKDLKSWGMKRV